MMDVSIRLEGKNKEVNIENAAVTELIMLMDSIADEVGLASFNDETQVQALTRYIEKLKELQTIVKSIKETEKPKRSSWTGEKPKESTLTGEKLKRRIKNCINDVVTQLPGLSEKDIEEKAKYIVADTDEMFDRIADEWMCDETPYETGDAVTRAVKIACEYMWTR